MQLLFRYSFIVILLLADLSSPAQDSTHVHCVYLEAFGAGGYGSINYDRELRELGPLKLRGRVALSTLNVIDIEQRFNPDVIVPIGLSLTYGKEHQLELGAGQTVTAIVETDLVENEKEREFGISAFLGLGYRYQPLESGFIFRLGYTPLIEFYDSFRHWGGLSIGYRF